MPDREKVIKGVFEMLQRNTWKDIDPERYRFQPVLNDALSLLKEQEAVVPIPPTDESDLWKCGNCNHQLFRCTHQKFCEECGRKIGWEDM